MSEKKHLFQTIREEILCRFRTGNSLRAGANRCKYPVISRILFAI